jgi:hypothetical protein
MGCSGYMFLKSEGGNMKKLNLSLEEWDLVYCPYWYRVGLDNATLTTSDLGLALSFSDKVEYLGRIAL